MKVEKYSIWLFTLLSVVLLLACLYKHNYEPLWLVGIVLFAVNPLLWFIGYLETDNKCWLFKIK